MKSTEELLRGLDDFKLSAQPVSKMLQVSFAPLSDGEIGLSSFRRRKRDTEEEKEEE